MTKRMRAKAKSKTDAVPRVAASLPSQSTIDYVVGLAMKLRGAGVLRFNDGALELDLAPLTDEERAMVHQTKLEVPADPDAPKPRRDPREPKDLADMTREELEGFSLPDPPPDGEEDEGADAP